LRRRKHRRDRQAAHRGQSHKYKLKFHAILPQVGDCSSTSPEARRSARFETYSSQRLSLAEGRAIVVAPVSWFRQRLRDPFGSGIARCCRKRRRPRGSSARPSMT
jgi:hypothetical protein